MHIFLNALGASTSSGLTYLRNVLPELSRRGLPTTVSANHGIQPEFAGLVNIEFAELPGSHRRGTAARFLFEQTRLPSLVRAAHADVLISAGNFALRNSPVPQILLSGNSLYSSHDFSRDLLKRRELGMWLDTRIKSAVAKKSIAWADRTVAPTGAFAAELRRWTGRDVVTIHHGFDRDNFFSDSKPLPAEPQFALDSAKGALKLLYVSHYNYFRNFETLFRALPLIRKNLSHKPIRLFLTCKLAAGMNPGGYNPESALALVGQLGVRDEVVELGALPYHQLHQVYRSCDLYVTPSYAETFAHPLVEAMACGLPVIASDLAVHREVCGDAALYFSRFSHDELAQRVLESVSSGNVQRPRVPIRFSWREHVDRVLQLAESLIRKQAAAAA